MDAVVEAYRQLYNKIARSTENDYPPQFLTERELTLLTPDEAEAILVDRLLQAVPQEYKRWLSIYPMTDRKELAEWCANRLVEAWEESQEAAAPPQEDTTEVSLEARIAALEARIAALEAAL